MRRDKGYLGRKAIVIEGSGWIAWKYVPRM